MRRSIVFATLLFLLMLTSFGSVFADEPDDFEEGIVEEEPLDDDESLGPLDYQHPQVSADEQPFIEMFDNPERADRQWFRSAAKKDDVQEDISKYDGKWKIHVPDEAALKNDAVLRVMDKAKHHAISAPLKEPFSFDGKPLFLQYDARFLNGQDCGGGYIKLLTQPKGGNIDFKKFNDKTPYTIMFGPDKCGATSKLHLIIRYENPMNQTVNEHHAPQPSSQSKIEEAISDGHTHLYALKIQSDGHYHVQIDEYTVMSGDLNAHLNPPVKPDVEIDDPTDVKPEDWDEREKIPDPNAVKPDDWDENAPEEIVDEDATMPSGWLEDEEEYIDDVSADKPDDWDAEMDGEWEPRKIENPACASAPGCGPWTRPMKKNPAYKGKWYAPKIDNPNYKGKWSPKRIANPHFFEANAYEMADIGGVGVELWTMSDGILFDNFLITDDELFAKNFAAQTSLLKRDHEKRMKAHKAGAKYPWPLSALITAAEEKPYLWALYVLVVLAPLVGIVFMCCGGSSKSPSKDPSAAHHKDEDAAPEDDDEIVVDDEEDREPPELVAGTSQEHESASSAADENGSSAAEGSQNEEKDQKDAPRKRRPKARKAE